MLSSARCTDMLFNHFTFFKLVQARQWYEYAITVEVKHLPIPCLPAKWIFTWMRNKTHLNTNGHGPFSASRCAPITNMAKMSKAAKIVWKSNWRSLSRVRNGQLSSEHRDSPHNTNDAINQVWRGVFHGSGFNWRWEGEGLIMFLVIPQMCEGGRSCARNCLKTRTFWIHRQSIQISPILTLLSICPRENLNSESKATMRQWQWTARRRMEVSYEMNLWVCMTLNNR